MSYRLTTWAWSIDGLSTAERITLLALADCCNGSRRSISCWPSVSHLQEKTALSRRSVQRALATLEDRALLARKLGSGTRSTTYRLACVDSPNAALDLEDPNEQEQPQGRHSDAGGGATVTPQGRHSDTRGRHSDALTRKEPRIETVIPLGTERESQSKRGVDAMCLSQFPQGELIRIAREARPDIPDPSPVLAKFRAHVNGNEYPPEEWARRWRLWLLNERDNQRRQQAQAEQPSGEFGSFLAEQGRDLSANYEVIPNAR